MAHIIGKGRYARESYPSRKPEPQSSAIVRMGADSVPEASSVVLDEGLQDFFLLPRQQDVDDDPIIVTFPSWTNGNYLRVVSRHNLLASAGAAGAMEMACRVWLAISLDGAVTWNLVSTSISRIDFSRPVGGPENTKESASLLALIGPLTVTGTLNVALAAIIENPVNSGGTDILQYAPGSESGVNLIAEEVLASSVFQSQPFSLTAQVMSAPPFSP